MASNDEYQQRQFFEDYINQKNVTVFVDEKDIVDMQHIIWEEHKGGGCIKK